MMLRSSLATRVLGVVLAAGLLAGAAAAAIAPKEGRRELAARSLTSDSLNVHADTETLDSIRSLVEPAVQTRWDAFAASVGGQWQADLDKRNGHIAYAEGSGIPWISGRGNDLDASVVARHSRSGKVDLQTMESIAREFLPRVSALLGVDAAQLKLNQGRSGQPSEHLWFIDFDVEIDGFVVEGARVVFRINNGNLIQMGTENLPARATKAPRQRVGRAAARQTLADYIGGFYPNDVMVDRGSLHLLPIDVEDGAAAEGYRMGQGRGLKLVWQFSFRRPGEMGTFRGRVDATSGEMVDFHDVNEYGSATGGAYRGDRPAPEVVLPLPFANVAAGVYTNSAGLFSGTTGTTTLDGQFVRITDSCGSISKAADASGLIALGSSAGTDCTTPGTGGAGNTHASRTQFYAVNRAKEVGRGWLPSNTWLQGKLTANVNLNQTCNAYWNGSSLNFFRSGGGCVNTGELPGISLHEFGHGLDSNDGSGSSADNGTGETYGDFTAALATHSSCIGNGFLGSNCGGYGNACTSCSGVRDIDWAKHARNTPSTVANFTQTTCPNPSPSNPNYKGPCGKEGHCESLVSSEALWDLAARDLPSPGSGSAWATVDRLWYLSRSTATKGFNCTASGTWTSNGCFTGSYFRTMRAVDDDNGNLADGTPHGGALAAAFNRHGIACTTDTAWNVTFKGVASPAAPALAVTAGSNSAALSWSGSSGVYDVYRNEAGCNAGFTKVANDVAATSYNDTAVANGFTYYYQVVAQPSGNEAAASAPSSCQSVTPAGAPCTPPAAPTGVSASAASASQINLSWAASSGATSYTISRATTSGGPYTAVGTSATTSFSNTGLSCNTTYYYVVSASNGTCSSANSTQASAVTSACTGNVLTKGVPVTGISGATGSQQFWTMAVPSGATNLTFVTSGGTGDADLYVKFGSAPSTTVYDCRSIGGTTAETCTIATPSAGTYHVLIHAYSAFSGMSLTGNYTPGGACTPPAVPTGVGAAAASASQINVSWSASSGATSYTVSRSSTSGGPYSVVGTSATTSFANTGLTCNTTYYYVVSASNGTCSSGNSAQASAVTSACAGNVLTNGVPATGISGAAGSQQFWTLAVPSGATNLQFVTSGGTGDADLYVKFGSAPSTTLFDCKSEGSTNAESCSFAAPSVGTYHVLIRGYSAFSGMSLTGSYTTGGGGGELTTNGGFESGTTPWVFSGAARSTGAYPHSGVAYSILGGVNNASHTEYQQITIPTGATRNLSFWLNVTSDETTTTTQYDRLFVEVRSTTGTLLGTLATYSNLNKAAVGVYSQKTGLSLASWAGQTVRIQFRATTDSSLQSAFRVDDVSVQ